MSITIKKIPEAEFKALNCPVLFADEWRDRAFGVILAGENTYKFGWPTETQSPVVKWIDTLTCSFGVDLDFVIIDSPGGNVLHKMHLDYWLYDIQLFDAFLYVITEIEIIKMNTKDNSIIETYSLPDIYKNMEPSGSGFLVECLDGEVVRIE